MAQPSRAEHASPLAHDGMPSSCCGRELEEDMGWHRSWIEPSGPRPRHRRTDMQANASGASRIICEARSQRPGQEPPLERAGTGCLHRVDEIAASQDRAGTGPTTRIDERTTCHRVHLQARAAGQLVVRDPVAAQHDGVSIHPPTSLGGHLFEDDALDPSSPTLVAVMSGALSHIRPTMSAPATD